MQRRYLKADVASLAMPKGGIVVAMLAAIVLGALELTLGFLTVPHEYGHVWAARMVGHRVAVIQVRPVVVYLLLVQSALAGDVVVLLYCITIRLRGFWLRNGSTLHGVCKAIGHTDLRPGSGTRSLVAKP